MENFIINKIILNALEEDMPMGDITTDNLITEEDKSECRLICKQEGVIAGIDIFERVFKLIGGEFEINWHVKDGQVVSTGDLLAEIKGSTKTILKGERVALNIIQRMSGVASKTKEYVDILADYKTDVYDTRKTTPGLRAFEKYAVKIAGGVNHRYCLSDMVMIKDNHIKAAGSITNAVQKIKASIPAGIKIEVEAETLDHVREAVSCDVDVVMLDNMDVKTMGEAVQIVNGKCLLEASGNMGDKSEEELIQIAKTGVDYISVGGLTHSYTSLDISLKF